MEKFAYAVIGAGAGIVLTVALQATAGHAPETAMAHVAVPAMAGMKGAHVHPPREAPSGMPAPSVTHLVFPDASDGYNLQILVRNFDFAPASINGEARVGEGHAHVYVNGVKIGRVYGPWFHLPAALFASGENEVRVTLNANDHGEWTVGGEPVASTVRVLRPD